MAVSTLVDKFRSTGLALAEVTGGEPLLQPGTVPLLQQLQGVGAVLVETNGSRDISVIPAGVIAIMDIKCPSSGVCSAMDWENVSRLRPRDEVKFVVGDRNDYEWARQAIRKKQLSRRCQAVLIGTVFNQLNPADLAAWIIEDCLPVRLNLQMHKSIWPEAVRGV